MSGVNAPSGTVEVDSAEVETLVRFDRFEVIECDTNIVGASSTPSPSDGETGRLSNCGGEGEMKAVGREVIDFEVLRRGIVGSLDAEIELRGVSAPPVLYTCDRLRRRVFRSVVVSTMLVVYIERAFVTPMMLLID